MTNSRQQQMLLSFLLLFTLFISSSFSLSNELPVKNATSSLPTQPKPTQVTAAAPVAVAPAQTHTITTITTSTTTKAPAPQSKTSPITTTTIAPSSSTPTAAQLNEAKRIIQTHLTSTSDNRFTMNKPSANSPTSEPAPDSLETKVSDSTTQFGLNFLRNVDASSRDNIVISPLSLQNLLNMILLGSDNNSQTQLELIKTLGYDATDLIQVNSDDKPLSVNNESLFRPHEAMHNVLDSITRATHLPINQLQDLLNANTVALNDTQLEKSSGAKTVTGHLQTSLRPGEAPLSGQVNFTLANLILTDNSITLSDDYERNLRQYYHVNVEKFSRQQANNKTGSNKSDIPLHMRVNNWVKNQTQNQIEKLADEQDLQGDELLMVLLNAAHFKGHWLYTFNPKATSEQTFYNDGLETGATGVKFMRQKGTFGYADFGQSAYQAESLMAGKISSLEDAETLLTEDLGTKEPNSPSASQAEQQAPTIELSKEESKRLDLTSKLNCSALMLPFSLNDGQELSMVILLPTKKDGLAELINALSTPALNEVYKSLSEQQVQVELPKFGFESSYDAKTTLAKMGLSKMFNEAHLDKMFSPTTAKTSKKVAKVIHKAKISVDETGAEAAAASMASVVLRNFIRPPSPVFIANHPFLFVIRHNRSNMPLFMGRVSSF